eukprot:jgi/Picsp_1/1680/NSC_05154-R1_---NA---
MSQKRRLLTVAYKCAAVVARECKIGVSSQSLWTKAGSQGSVSRVSGRVDDFIEIADIIEDAFPQLMVEGVEDGGSEVASSSSLRITLEDGTPVISNQSIDEIKAHVVQRLEDMGLIHA